MNVKLPAEWESQSFIQIAWPNSETDWNHILDEAELCYINLATEIAKRQYLLICKPQNIELESKFNSALLKNIRFVDVPYNDTWTRDYGGITVYSDGEPEIVSYKFNGWGNKFSADLDNKVTDFLVLNKIVQAHSYVSCNFFILEGGSIESNGNGILLTTENCLRNKNRNKNMVRREIEDKLKKDFGVEKVLWLKYGELQGDDTDAHIDTIARFVGENTIMYIKCEDVNDSHFEEFARMEEELKAFKNLNGEPFELIALPFAEPVFDDGDRLPATYANFLIMNNTVLVPTYNTSTDNKALQIIASYFTNREVVGIDCSALIKQHGSLHCATMQYPAGVNLIF